MTTTTELVSGKFDQAEQYAEEAWTLAEEFLVNLGEAAIATGPDEASLYYAFTPLVADSLDAVAPTSANDFSVTVTPFTGAPSPIEPYVAPYDIDMPDKTWTSADFTISDEPDLPDVTDPVDPGEPQALSPIAIPAKPVLEYPTEPAFQTHLMPTKSTLTIPAFMQTLPVDDIVAPVNNFNYLEVVYESDLLDSVKAKLAADLTSGGTGLGAEAEEAIWERAQDRQAELDEKLYDETMNFFASRGWNMPTGAMASRLAEAHNESRRSSEKLNNDILVQQSQLAYQNIKDTITAIIGLEQALIQHADTVANRGLETAKYAVEAAVNICNAQIAKLGMALERYKAAVVVYETEFKMQGLLLDFYTKELSAVEIENQIDLTTLEKYKALLSGVQLKTEVYKTEMQGAALEADFESKKLENFRLLVDIYTARINANTQKYNQYKTEWEGIATKISAKSELVKVYSAEVDGQKLLVDMNKTEADIVSSINDSNTKNFASEVAAYEAGLKGDVALIDAQSKEFDSMSRIYEADIKLAIGKAEMNLKTNEANLRTMLAQLELELKQAEVNIANMNQANQLRLEAAKAGAAVTAQMASSSLSSVNASASQGITDSNSWDQTKNVHTYSHSFSSECTEC